MYALKIVLNSALNKESHLVLEITNHLLSSYTIVCFELPTRKLVFARTEGFGFLNFYLEGWLIYLLKP